MSAVVDFVKDVVTTVVEAIEDLVIAVWDAVVEPILGMILAIFGITDETIVTVQRISSPIYDTNVVDVVEAGIVRTILGKIKTDTSFFPNYMQQIYRTKGQIRAYYRYAELNIYYAGLPTMDIQGTFVNFSDVSQAIDTELGTSSTILSAVSRNPSRYDWYYYALQAGPEFFQPWDNTLTAVDEWGTSYSGWLVGLIEYNSGPDDYTINISRDMEEAQFWILGPQQITEGDTATMTIHSNRPIPLGQSVEISFTYGGTAVDPTDYTQVASVVMPELTDEVTVDIVTVDSVNSNTVFTMTISNVDNTGSVFEAVTINGQDTVTTTITDNDTLRTNMQDIIVDEANVTITVDVTLSQVAPSGAFSVDYDFTDLGSIVGGVDYDNTPGTLNFLGTAGEVQQISVDIYADVASDDREQFEIYLTNSSDLDSIDISAVSTVTIIDGTLNPPADTKVVDETLTEAPFVSEPSIVVSYQDDSAPAGEFNYWIHPHSDTTWDLQAKDQTITGLEMLPMAILRKEKMMLDELYPTTSNEYVTTKMLMARAGLDINEFLDAIKDNPDIGTIDDAYINFSVAPLNVNRQVSKMLYLAWEIIITQQGLSSNVGQFSATITEGDIQNAIVWSGHTVTTNNIGTKTTTGEYLHEVLGTTMTMWYQRIDGFYDEIVMTNLNGFTAINYGSYHEVALCKLGDDEFTIPISWDIFQQMTAEEQMEVYQYICRVDVNAIDITHLEWYETEAFFDLFEFAMVVISIAVVAFTLGSGSGVAVGLLGIVQTLVINYAIGELILFVAELTGNDIFAALVGVAAAVYLNNPELLSTDALMNADVLLDLSTDFVDNMMLLDDANMQELAGEIEDLNKEAQANIDAELANREDTEAVSINSQFLNSVQQQDTTMFPAIAGNYAYDSLYNYDSLVGNYHEQQLQTGVK